MRIGLFLIIAATVARTEAQPSAMLEEALRGVRSISTLSCAMVRIQSFNGVRKTSRCDFFFDRQRGRRAYSYAAPYEYTFTADDSVFCGVNRKSGQGYSVTTAGDASHYKALLGSIDMTWPLLRLAGTDTLDLTLKASINNFLYFERPLDEGNEMIKVDRGRGAVVGIEWFDKSGDVRCQTTFDYDTTGGKKPLFPRRIAVKQNPTGIIFVDTLLISKVKINKKLKESAFELN
jgi:outer membrane lipoprotein-sorting protein